MESNRHLLKANSNNATLSLLRKADTDHSDWITVIAFYKSLHIVEAVFAHNGDSHSRNHESRERLLKTKRSYSNIYMHYRPLWAAATVARYLAARGVEYQTFSDYMPTEDVEKKVVRHYLHQIERSAVAMLGESCGLVRCVNG